ncbi:3-carboxy-cis,cis-muconate cycloisomerase [Roseivivax marinus]|uniref:3-carboxy-cis,cis-muconate cycloisomerase n=1 Tax=Roseivivax marinus TaxID=1379903 RepID=UPI00273D06EF|nr:3-carboxy-cis,cis-muconate cycloisomerase [Roseivivax marinus]
MAARSLAPLTALDSPLWGPSFVDDDMRELVSADAFVDACVTTEAALARAQARLGIIPKEAAEGISAAAETLELDRERLAHETAVVGYPILPLVEQMSAACGPAGKHLHWGATTQDIMDTATVLQLRGGLDLIERRLDAVRDALATLARDHRDTVLAGRTHLQHALPVTFGWKAAVWLSALDRHKERLAQVRPRLLVVQFSGASGTLASLGDRGLEVQAELAAELDLGVPDITWHAMRDSVAEAVQLMALIGGSLGKIACDVSVMMTTEVGEVSEPFARHRGASSTMPQKQNPISCELILAAARLLRNHATTMLDAMIHDFERATGPWHLEWSAVPEGFALASGALAQAEFLLSGLQVRPDAMARNLASTRGLIVAEAVMMALAPHTGRTEAHDIVYRCCRAAIAGDTTLLEALAQDDEVTAHLDRARLETLTAPENYLGTAGEMVDRLLAQR